MVIKTDVEILNAVVSGETEKFALLVDRYKNMAFTIAYRITRVREDAEEIAQDAFLKAYNNLAFFRKESGFSTWFYRIVYNTAISHKRLKKPISSPVEEAYALAALDSQQNHDYDEDYRHRLIERIMNCLTEEDRVIVTLFYLNESDIKDISAVTGLSRSVIKVRLFRARKRIQEEIAGNSQLVFI